MAICSVCKKRRLLNAKFCPYCGSPAESIAAAVTVEGLPQHKGPAQAHPDPGVMQGAAGMPSVAPITQHLALEMPARTTAVTAASLALLFLGGGVFIFSAFLVVVTIAFRGAIGSLLYFIPAPYLEVLSTNATALIMEFATLALAALYAVAGVWLWRSHLKGGILGAILVAISISTTLSLLVLTPLWGISLSWAFGGIVGLWFVVHLQILLSLLSGWGTLRP